MSTQRKFIDRDVRENPDYLRVAAEYLGQYQGEFEYLIDCKMRLAQERTLSIGMIRGILNCMLVDPRIDLPEPEHSDGGNVVQFVPKAGKRWSSCFLEEVHGPHDTDYVDMIYACSGVYPINRYVFTTPAKIKAPYVVGTSGRLIHKIESAECEWFPNFHEYGFQEDLTRLLVKAACPITRLKDPMLTDSCEEYSYDDRGEMVYITKCKRCFPSPKNEQLELDDAKS